MIHLKFMFLFAIALAMALTASEAGPVVEATAARRDNPLSLEQAVNAALLSNCSLRADSLEIAVQSANLRQARLPGNPELVVESENARPGDGAQLSIDLAQPFHPLARRKKSDVAKSEKLIARVHFQMQKLDLIACVKTRFIMALSLQKLATLTDSLVQIAQETHRASVSQAITGKTSFSDTLQTSAGLALARLQRNRINQNRTDANQDLASLWASANTDFECYGSELDTIPPLPDSTALLTTLSASPHNMLAIAELDKKQSELSLEKSLRIPTLRAGAGIGIVRGADDVSPRASLSFSVPVINRNQGAVKAAHFGVLQAENNRDEASTRNHALALNAYRNAAQLHSEIQMLKSSILPQLRESLDASYIAFVSGKTGILALLEAQRSFYETSRDYIETCRNYLISLFEIERIASTDKTITGQSPRE